MSGTGAIFLSYASEDAEAAQRICEALRSAGLEVWFDQSELRARRQGQHRLPAASGARDLPPADRLQLDLAAVVPLRPHGVALAVADLPELAAVAGSAGGTGTRAGRAVSRFGAARS
jgi:hypothetical protein